MHIIWMLHNVYPVYEANVMYQYKLVAKVGTALALVDQTGIPGAGTQAVNTGTGPSSGAQWAR